MWMYNQTPSSDELYHYGVLGMKWGVRHDRSRARIKADAKTKKLKAKSEKAKAKSRDAEMKLAKRRSKKARTEIGYGLQERAFRKANSKKYKSMKAEKKLSNWEKAVNKEFDPGRLRDIDNRKAYKQLVKNERARIQKEYNDDPWARSQAKSLGKWFADTERALNPDKYATRRQTDKYKKDMRNYLEKNYKAAARSAEVKLSRQQKKTMKTMSDKQLREQTEKYNKRASDITYKRNVERMAKERVKERPMTKQEVQKADAYFKKLEKAEAKLNSQLQAQANAGNRGAYDYLHGTGSFIIKYDKNGNPTVKKKR